MTPDQIKQHINTACDELREHGRAGMQPRAYDSLFFAVEYLLDRVQPPALGVSPLRLPDAPYMGAAYPPPRMGTADDFTAEDMAHRVDDVEQAEGQRELHAYDSPSEGVPGVDHIECLQQGPATITGATLHQAHGEPPTVRLWSGGRLVATAPLSVIAPAVQLAEHVGAKLPPLYGPPEPIHLEPIRFNGQLP